MESLDVEDPRAVGPSARRLREKERLYSAALIGSGLLSIALLIVIIVQAAGHSSGGIEGPKLDLEYSRDFRTASWGFAVNRDFVVTGAKPGMSRTELLGLMKDQTERKSSFFVVNDKVIMGNMLERMGIPTNEVYASFTEGSGEDDIRAFAEKVLREKADTGFIVKPTHTSMGQGVAVVKPGASGWDADRLYKHVKECLGLRVKETESWVLRNMKPRVIFQELYNFKEQETAYAGESGEQLVDNWFHPFEVKVMVIWGKFFQGLMEGWGPSRKGGLQYWIRADGVSSCDWYAQGKRPGVDSPCLEPLDRDVKAALPSMKLLSQKIATQLGAAWLRVDFFVGGKQGLRVNELAYGSTLPHPTLNRDLAKLMIDYGWEQKKYFVMPEMDVLAPLGCSRASDDDVASIECASAAEAPPQPSPFSDVHFDSPDGYTRSFLEASEGFVLNSDFKVTYRKRPESRQAVLDVMKAQTEHKSSFIVVNDKANLATMMEALQVPQMKAYKIFRLSDERDAILESLRKIADDYGDKGFILKPTHTSEGAGVMRVKPGEEQDVDRMADHVQECLSMKAKAHESWTLRNLKPAVIVQEIYRFQAQEARYKEAAPKVWDRMFRPYEVKVQTIWGKFFLGQIEGYNYEDKAEKKVWALQYWIRRDGTSSCDWYDQGKDPKVPSKCLEPLDRDIKSVHQQIVEISEKLAASLKASWLRVDFFVGGEQGLRVNELGYGSGHYFPPNLENDVRNIMYEGMTRLRYRVMPAEEVLNGIHCPLKKKDDPTSVECYLPESAQLALA